MQKTYNVSELPFEQLFALGQQKFNQMDYEQAQYYYSLAYQKKPHDDMIVLCYANTLKYNCKKQQAENILISSLKRNPNGNYKRYFQLGQLEDGEKSIKIFQEGIAAANKCLSNPFLSINPEKEVKRDIAQAYASIAQVCMTDLCNIPFEQVESKCFEVLEKGRAIDPTCIDVTMQIANCLIEKGENQLAKKELLIMKELILEQKEQYQDQMITQCAKHFMEIGQHQHAIDVLQKLNQNQNNEPQTIYLLAFAAYNLQDYNLCKQYIEQYPQNQTIDEEVNIAMMQLKKQLQKKIKKTGDSTEEGCDQEQWMDVQDDGQQEFD